MPNTVRSSTPNSNTVQEVLEQEGWAFYFWICCKKNKNTKKNEMVCKWVKQDVVSDDVPEVQSVLGSSWAHHQYCVQQTGISLYTNPNELEQFLLIGIINVPSCTDFCSVLTTYKQIQTLWVSVVFKTSELNLHFSDNNATFCRQTDENTTSVWCCSE